MRIANGLVGVAPVVLQDLRIDRLAIPHLPATVGEAPIGLALFGASFLARSAAWRPEGKWLHRVW